MENFPLGMHNFALHLVLAFLSIEMLPGWKRILGGVPAGNSRRMAYAYVPVQQSGATRLPFSP